MDSRSDQELIRQYRDGDERALAFLIERYLPLVYRFVYRLVGDEAQAQDITQDTFIKAWRSLHSYDLTKSFKTWVFSIARNTAIDVLRKKNPTVFSRLEQEGDFLMEDVLEDERPLADAQLERAEVATVVNAALASIPVQSRSVILMHELEDLTFQEIADIVQEPMNTVKSRYRRALAQLRAYLVKVLPSA